MAKDSSPNGNHGTIVKGTAATENAAATWGDGHAGKALQFNGSDDWVRVPDSDSIDSTGVNGTWSIAAWVNISRNADPVLDKFNFFASRHEDQTAYDHLGLGVRNTFLTGAVHFTFATGTTPFPLDKWTHVAATYDALTLVIYQDGVQAGEIAVGYPIGTDSTFFAIGGDWNVDTMKEFTQGYLDDVYLYNTALTADQVAALAK